MLGDLWIGLPSPPFESVLKRNGITWDSAVRVGGLRWHGVRWLPGGRFSLDAEEPAALLVGCHDYHHDARWVVDDPAPFDLVAFHPVWPQQFATLHGSAVMLGEANMHPALADGPVRVRREPLAWVRAGGRGVVPLDLPAFARQALGRAVVCDDVAHGKAIKAACDAEIKWTAPRISVAAVR